MCIKYSIMLTSKCQLGNVIDVQFILIFLFFEFQNCFTECDDSSTRSFKCRHLIQILLILSIKRIK